MMLGNNSSVTVKIEGNHPTADTMSDTFYESQSRHPLKHRVISFYIRGERWVMCSLNGKADSGYVAAHFRRETAQLHPLSALTQI